ncbi:rhomboid-domain-containing protein [Daedalea quercina L-15889]|uniref:Rhomboid-type serine protease n=1 Tax=Daedalea quercina L-15889 TaxID=1314783 RepID=A0A165ULV1_9APHY|nr:rhomboid-domain-containing protein [Daedalea quercina L-15889]
MIIEDMASSQTSLHDPPEYASDSKSALLRRGHSYKPSDAAYDAAYNQPYYAEAAYNPSYRPAYPDADYAYNPDASAANDAQDKQEIQEISYAKTPEQYGMRNYENMGYDEPFSKPPRERPNPIRRYLGLYPLEDRIADKKAGVGVQRRPYLVWLLSLIMLAVLIYELVVNDKAQGTPVSFHPTVNPMLGPSESALINVGARFPACMKSVEQIPLSTELACLNDTANPVTEACPLETICGFGGFHDETPNQWFRFITPIFLHAGIVHYLLNMLAQLIVSAQVEREIGTPFFLVLYMAAGIFGNVLGGNFALVGVPSVGASGAIFGTTAVAWVDLFAHWRYQYQPGKKLAWMVVELIIGIALGFIPSHLGGLLMGLLVGMAFYPIISPSLRHRSIVLGLRLGAVVLAIVLFVVLIRNFYTSNPYAACSWCRYLSCIPTSSNNYCKGTGLSTSSSF